MSRKPDEDDIFTSSASSTSNLNGKATATSVSDPEGGALQSAGNMRAHLQSLLEAKEKQLQQAGSLGQRVLAQQMELEQHVRQLQEIDADRGEREEPSAEMRLRYRDLTKTLDSWDEENAKLTNALGAGPSLAGEPAASSSQQNVAENQLPHGAQATSASQSRRAKNAAHRANDVEFAFEIGSSLLTEVRRLQSLLGERDKVIQDMKEERDDMGKADEALRTALRQQEQNADKYREENWNLEVQLQELRSQLSESQAAAQRGESESKRLAKALASTRESHDAFKNEVDNLQKHIEETKMKHENDVNAHRKHAAALTREKSDMQQSVENYKAELARLARRVPRHSPYTPDGRPTTPGADDDEEDPFGPGTTGMGMSTNRRRLDTSALFPPDAFGPESVDNSPDPSPSRPFLSPRLPTNELEALQQKLAHAQRQISTLKGTLAKEKELRMDYRRKLMDTGVQGIRLEDDDDEEDDDDDDFEEEMAKSPVRASPFRRGRGGFAAAKSMGRTLAQKLLAAQQAADDEDSYYEESDMPSQESEPYQSTIQQHMSTNGQTAETSMVSPESQNRDLSPEPEADSVSNRGSIASIEGMDPAFANVLHRQSSLSSASRRGSPLTRGGRGTGSWGRRRGGTAFQAPRPTSVVGAPEALALELGLGNSSIGMESVKEDEKEQKEYSEFACQTAEEASPAPVAEDVKPEMVDVSMQCEAEPIPEPIIALTVERKDISTQTLEPSRISTGVATEKTPKPVLAHMSVGTDEPPKTVSQEMNVQTDPIPEPEPVVREVIKEVIKEVLVEAAAPEQPLRVDAEMQTTSEQHWLYGSPNMPSSPLAQRRLRYLSTASAATAVPLQVVQDVDEDAQTEHAYTSGAEPETETDADNYHDARSAAMTPSATDSLNDDDFHSMSTMTDNDFSDEEGEDSEGESLKASVLNMGTAKVERAVSPHQAFEEAPPTKTVQYESTGMSTEEPKPVPLPKAEEDKENRPVLVEMSIQTDEWQPSTQVPPGFGLYRVGPNAQQFQFVSPSPTSGLPVTASAIPLATATSTPPAQLRDSTNTPNNRPTRFASLPGNDDKQASLDSTNEFGQRQHTQSLSTMSPSIDKSRPPMMTLPPPPKVPPPPNSMPPPSFIPEKRRPTSALSHHRDTPPPPRPTSPPPPELIQRATTPTFGSGLTVPSRSTPGNRQFPPSTFMRQTTSTTSFRSGAQPQSVENGHTPSNERTLRSAASLLSDENDGASRRSSISSELHQRGFSDHQNGFGMGDVPATPSAGNMPTSSTDPAIIHAITQTMIGEFLYKYTRRAIGKGHGERRHKRFFWVHPYTKTLYWSSGDPGSTNVVEQSAKSAYIDSVRQILDPNPMPPGLYQYSIVISTPQRDMKFTAPTKERHEIWLNALRFLLERPTPQAQSPTATQVHGPPVTPSRGGSYNDKGAFTSPMSQRTGRSEVSGMSNESPWSMANVTPRGGQKRSRSRVSMVGSVGKRSGTPAAEYLRWSEVPGSPTSSGMRGMDLAQSNRSAEGDSEELDFEINDPMSDQEGFEGLENVRACCDGRHTVGRASGIDNHTHTHTHTHAYDHLTYGRATQKAQAPTKVHRPIPQFAPPISGRNVVQESHSYNQPQPTSRPSSPAFSFRSKTSSRKSGEHSVANIFSRFGTRRSKTPALPIQDS